MAEIWTMGETLVEIMRADVNKPLNRPELFSGPYPSGSSAIMISTVARLGHSGGIISGVGDDAFGECILSRLKHDGVNVSKVLVDSKDPTACAFVSYDDTGDRNFLFHWDNTPATKAKMPDLSESIFNDTKFFHIMGCALTAKIDYGFEIVKTAQAFYDRGVKISFDPNIRREHLRDPEKGNLSFDIINSILKITNIFAPGADELKIITGIEDTEKAIKKCFENPNLEILFLKNGSMGSKVYTRDGDCFLQGLFSVKAVDPTGAGDTSIGAFLCALIEGKDIPTCAKIAAAAGALNVMAFGPMEGCISKENINAMINGTYKM